MSSQPPVAPPPPLAASRRRRLLQALALLVVAALVIAVAYRLLVGRYHEVTDNAYVSGNLVAVTPEVGGTVVSIAADDTDRVEAGQPLVRYDQSDSRVAVEQAEAQLAKTVRDVRTLYASTDALRATLEVRTSDVARARDDLKRREALAASGAVSKEELDHAREALAGATAAEASARQQWESNRAQTEGTDVASHPLVRQAAGRLREVLLASSRGTVRAPVSGYVAHRTVQLGARVAAGAPLMVLVPLDGVWVDANFKEDQLANLRIGQPVTLNADLYGGAVEYHGRVAGLGAGTGTVFSLLPAQNATGNWIKVVQRLPVRIALDPRELAAHPLKVGLSMDADIDVAG